MEREVAIAVLCIAGGGIACQWLGWRYRLPAITLLFAVGLVVGPGLQLLHPSAALGPALRPVIGLAVAVVVFEGGLSLNFRDLRAAGQGVLRLTTIAMPLHAVLATLAARLIGGFGWGAALLFGAITIVTGPTVVAPMLRHVRLEPRAAAFLRWEAIIGDPVGAILASVALQAMAGSAAHLAGWGLLPRVVAGVAVAALLGLGAALLVRRGFSRDLVPEYLKTPVLLALVLVVYALSNLVMPDAGLTAATLFGIGVANLGIAGISELRRFKEALVTLLVSALFIVLTADLDRSVLGSLTWGVLALTVAMLVLVRPAAILLATARSGLTWPERALAGWIAPRGIVAAAVAGVAGLRLQQAGFAGAELVMPAVFALIAATMLLHGFSMAPLARRLGLVLGEGPGVLIVGASSWSTALAAALETMGVNATIADIYPGALRAARGRGVPVLQAEMLSRHGEERFQERPIDYVIAATQDDAYNGLVCARFAPELGRERVFQVAPPTSAETDPHTGVTRELRGKVLADSGLDFDTLAGRMRDGWRFAVRDEAEEGADGAGVAFVRVRRGGCIAIPSPDDRTEVAAETDDRVLALVPPEGDAEMAGAALEAAS